MQFIICVFAIFLCYNFNSILEVTGMFGEQVKIVDALFISLFSIVVVFIVLFLISFITDVVAFLVNRKTNSKIFDPNNNNLPIVSVNQTSSLDNSTIVAIAAAVCVVYSSNPNKLIIKSIKRIKKWR